MLTEWTLGRKRTIPQSLQLRDTLIVPSQSRVAIVASFLLYPTAYLALFLVIYSNIAHTHDLEIHLGTSGHDDNALYDGNIDYYHAETYIERCN